MTKTNLTSLDVEGHDGSAAGLYIGSTLVTATATELNYQFDYQTVQAITTTGQAITNKNGVCTVSGSGILASTIAQPTATTDDFKRLKIIALSAHAHTVTIPATGWGGNTALTVATFSGAVGDCLDLLAYQGIWYVTNVHQVTFA
jgi:hypothetical protein